MIKPGRCFFAGLLCVLLNDRLADYAVVNLLADGADELLEVLLTLIACEAAADL